MYHGVGAFWISRSKSHLLVEMISFSKQRKHVLLHISNIQKQIHVLLLQLNRCLCTLKDQFVSVSVFVRLSYMLHALDSCISIGTFWIAKKKLLCTTNICKYAEVWASHLFSGYLSVNWKEREGAAGYIFQMIRVNELCSSFFVLFSPLQQIWFFNLLQVRGSEVVGRGDQEGSRLKCPNFPSSWSPLDIRRRLPWVKWNGLKTARFTAPFAPKLLRNPPTAKNTLLPGTPFPSTWSANFAIKWSRIALPSGNTWNSNTRPFCN